MHVGYAIFVRFLGDHCYIFGFWDRNKRSMVDLVASWDHHLALHLVSCALDSHIKTVLICLCIDRNLPLLEFTQLAPSRINQLIALESHLFGPSANCQSMSLLASSCWKTATLWFFCANMTCFCFLTNRLWAGSSHMFAGL